jgi:LmbE family N-acetylglucosaminyl deacetylase
VIDRLITAGATVDVLCFTRGEASTLGAEEPDLPTVRHREITEAARELGIRDVHLLAYPDGALDTIEPDDLTAHVLDIARDAGAQGLLAFDSTGVTGHRDHIAATVAAERAGAKLGLDVLAWTLPASVADDLGTPFLGRDDDEIDIVLTVGRAGQRRAVTCHPSQAVPGSALWRRLDLLGDREYLRWLSPRPDRRP